MGRSLGTVIGSEVIVPLLNERGSAAREFYENDLSGVIASACLAHDIGNPAFGHSGEKAIAWFFENNHQADLEGKSLKSYFTDAQWSDLVAFEGNANALRHLTKAFIGRLEGGQRLTYLTLASILKYPCSSESTDTKSIHRKKYGFFQSETDVFTSICAEFGFEVHQKNGIYSRRHPFVYLVEAADDICYRIIDMEDAHRIHILSFEEISQLFLSLIGELSTDKIALERTKDVFHKIQDRNESIAYLRTKCIGGLVEASAGVFREYGDKILGGEWNESLIGRVELKCPTLKKIQSISIEKIYNHPSVIEVELAGYNVMSEILKVFIPAILKTKRSNMEKKSLLLIPAQFNLSLLEASPYDKVMGVLDFVSGMTDGYATELYRKIKGIDIARHH